MFFMLGIACLGVSAVCFASLAAERNPNPVVIYIGFITGWVATLMALLT